MALGAGLFGYLVIGLWASVGALGCSLLAARKRLDETIWFVLGAALGPVGMFILARDPGDRAPSFLVADARRPHLIECPSCRSVVGAAAACSLCSEPLPAEPRPGSSSGDR